MPYSKEVSFAALLLLSSCLFTACEKDDNDTDDLPDRLEFTASRQYPEGIAWSSELNAFVITSLTQGKLGTVDKNGVYTDLIVPDELVSGVGVKVANGKIYVCNSDNGVSTKSSPLTTQKLAELLIFNISSRQLERRIDLDGLLPLNNHFANDLAVAPDGTVYVTDSYAPVIYKITTDNQVTILVRDDVNFAAPAFGLNGIVYHPDGYLIVTNTGQGKLFKVSLSNNAVTEVGGLAALPGDGLLLTNNTELYVVTGGGTRVAQLQTNDGFATATLVKTHEGVYSGATTSTKVDDDVYTLNARINEIQAAAGDANKLQSNDYSIQEFD